MKKLLFERREHNSTKQPVTNKTGIAYFVMRTEIRAIVVVFFLLLVEEIQVFFSFSFVSLMH